MFLLATISLNFVILMTLACVSIVSNQTLQVLKTSFERNTREVFQYL